MPTPSLQCCCHPVFVCICMLNNWHVTNRQAICKHAKTTEAKQKGHNGTEQHYRYMQSYSKHTTHTNSIFFHYQVSPLAIRSEGELQIQIHLAALSGCCKLELTILTLIRANEQHSHVLSKDPQTGGNIQFSSGEQMLCTLWGWLQTSLYILYHLWWVFFYHLHYFKLWKRHFLTFTARSVWFVFS